MNNIDDLTDTIYAVQEYMDETYGDNWTIKDGANDWDADCLVEALYEGADDTENEEEDERDEYTWRKTKGGANIYRIHHGWIEDIPIYMARCDNE